MSFFSKNMLYITNNYFTWNVKKWLKNVLHIM